MTEGPGEIVVAQVETYAGEADKLEDAIALAEAKANDFLNVVPLDTIVSVTTQTIATPWRHEATSPDRTTVNVFYVHLITVVYRAIASDDEESEE